MIITLACPEHGDWHPDLASARSRSTCPAPGCTFRGVPRAGQFRAPAQDVPPSATPAEPDNGVRLAGVDAATGELAEPLRAMIRWLLSAACYRQHCRAARPPGHPGGIAAGPTNTGKTFIAYAVGQALGIEPEDFLREVAKQPDGALWGRTIARDGGRYEFTRAAVLAGRFVCLDELGDARGDKQAAALRLLQGETLITVDGQQVDMAAVPYATTNQPLGDLPESRRRRCACLHTTGLPPLSYGTARRVLASIPTLPLSHLKPSAVNLPTEVRDGMDEALRACLTPAGLRLLDLRGLEAVALGRAGIEGTGDLDGAAIGTLRDYLVMAATTGEAYPDWPDRLRRWLDGEPGSPVHGEDGQEAGPDQAAVAYWDTAEAVGYAGTIGHRLGRAIEDLAEAAELPGVPGGALDEAAGIEHMAKRLVGPDLRKVRDGARLAEILPTAQRVTQLAEDRAADMRAAAAGYAAREYQAGYEAAVAAELHRRAQLQAAAQPAAIESRPAAYRPPPPTVAETLAAYRRSRYPAKGLGGKPAPAASADTGIRFQPAWTIAASVEPAPTPPPRRAPAAPSRAAALAAARAVRVALPAADTSVAGTLMALTQQRAEAGLPPPTGSEIAQLYLAASPR